MKPVLLLILLTFAVGTHAQDSANWIRVQSDDGRFSIDVPAEHSYIFDKKGFSVGWVSSHYELRDVSFLNSYQGDTLLTVEAYNAARGAMDALFETAKPGRARESSPTVNGIKTRRFENKTDNSYLVSYFMRDKEWIYVVSAASRTGETPDMKRFIDSVRLDSDIKGPLDTAVKLSSLTRSTFNLITKVVHPPALPAQPGPKKEPDPTIMPVIILSKPRASYTDEARHKRVTGGVRFRLELSEKGNIPTVEVVETLPEGLARQSLFAALRLKFLPKLKDGRPIPTRVTLEYTFSIY